MPTTIKKLRYNRGLGLLGIAMYKGFLRFKKSVRGYPV
jgi:hypothetical protein